MARLTDRPYQALQAAGCQAKETVGQSRVVAIMLKWFPILPFAGFIALMSCSRNDPVDAAVVAGPPIPVTARG